MSSGKYACSACLALLTGELAFVKERACIGACQVCDDSHLAGVGGPLSWPQLNQLLDLRKLWRPKPGGEAVLVQSPSRCPRVVPEHRLGAYVHVLDVANVGAAPDDEPWFTVRVVGEEPPPGSVYPAYPQSALAKYELTRASLLARQETLKANIRSMPTSEKLRLAADFLDGGHQDHALGVLRLAVAEVDGSLPKVPMPSPEVPR